MPGGKQSSRFEMLLNVSLGGMDKFKALGSTAKKAALGMSNLTQALDKVNASEVEAKQNIKDVIKDLEAYIKTYDKYQKSLENLDNKLKASNAETKVGQKAIARARDTVREHTKALTKYKNAVNDVVPGLVNMTKQNGKIRGQQKTLKTTTAVLKEELKLLGKANQRATKETKDLGDESVKTSKDAKRLSGAIRENEFAVDRLRQRLKRSDIPAFRKRLGALRNQILVLTFAFGGLVRAFQRAFDEANILQSAMRGLGAVAANTGNGLQESQRAAMNLTENGLLTVQDAAAGLKNLLSAGFGLKEATALMNTLTDAASFNRQGTLSLGQAVVGATQGIKNQNSIMVDNAGITKNLSIMYKEYAESIGTTAGKIDEAQKRQAIFNGILKEGAVFAGDSERVLGTMSGQLAKLGTNARAAAAGVGELIQPFAMGFVAAISSGAESLKQLGEEAKASTDVQVALIKTGYQIENVFSSLGKVFTTIAQALNKVGLGFGGLVTTLAKLAIGYRVLFAVQNRLRAGTLKTAEAAQHMSEIYDIQSRQVIGAVNTKTGKLISQYQLLKIEILKNNEAIREQIRVQKLNIPTTDAVMKQIFKMDLSIKGVVLRTKALVISLGNFSRLAKIAGQAAMALGRAFKGIAIQLIAIEAIFIVVQKLIGFFGSFFESQDQIKLNAERATTANEALNKSFEGTVASLSSVTAEAKKFANVDFSFLEAQANVLEKYKERVNEAAAALANATSLDAQAEAQTQLDTVQGLYDNALAKYKSYLMEVQSATNEHISRIQGANTMYNEQYEKSIEHLGLKGYNDTRQSYLKIEQAIQDFQKTKIHMTEKSEAEILNAEEQLYNARLIALQNFESERQKLIASGLNDAIKKNEIYTAKLLDLDKSEADRIKASYDRQIAEMKKNLNAQVQAIETTLSEADKQALAMFDSTKGALKQAGPAFAASVQPISAPYAGQGGQDYATEVSIGDTMVDGNTMGLNQSLEILPKVSSAYQELNAIYQEYRSRIMAANGDQAKVIQAHEDMRDKMFSSQVTMGSLLKRVEDLGHGESRLADNLRKTNDSMTNFNKAAGNHIAAYKSMTKETKENSKAEKEVRDETSKTITVMEAYLSQQSALRQSSVLYKEELKGIAAKQKDVNDALKGGDDKFKNIQGSVDIQNEAIKSTTFTLDQFKKETFASSGQLKNLMNVFTKSDSIRAFSQNMIELNNSLGVSGSTLARQARELANFKAGQDSTIQGLVDRKEATIAMADAEKELFDKMEANKVVMDENDKVVSGTYTQADIDRQYARVQVADAKIEAINKEIEGTKKLTESERIAFEEGLDIARMQERMEAFQNYASFFGGFITQMQNMEQKRLNANKAYQRKIEGEIDKGIINQTQGNALMLENQKLTNAQKELDEAKYIASLIRNVGQIIMMEMAKQAASAGNPLAALALFGAGLAGMAIANNAANKIESKAQDDYNKAEAEFQNREAEIRGEGEEQGAGSATGSQKFGGSIKAENLAVTISPTVVISGEQVFIGQGSVTEFGAEMQALLLTSMQDAVENREIDLTQAANLEG